MIKKSEIKISVCIPTYNRYEVLKRALESALIQNFNDMEILVIDDFSREDIWEKVKMISYLDKKNLKIIRNDKNKGLCDNWTESIYKSNGEYILILASDDELLPRFVEKTVKFLDAHPDAGLVHTNGYNCYNNGKREPRITQNKPILKRGLEALTKSITNHNFICSSVVMRREACKDGFLSNNPSPDAEMYARIGRDYDIGHIDDFLVNCYINDDSEGNRLILEQPVDSVEKQWKFIMEKILSYFPEQNLKEARKLAHNSFTDGLFAAGAIAWRKNKWKRGYDFFSRAFKYIPFTTYIRKLSIIILSTIKFKILQIITNLNKYIHCIGRA